MIAFFKSLRRQRGLTFLELVVALMVLLVLASAAVPLARWDEKRRRENRLRIQLGVMRSAIDQYKKMADQGQIVQTDVEQMGYPLTLEELVEGVEVTTVVDPGQVGQENSPAGGLSGPGAPGTQVQVVRFLKRFPEDPISGEMIWGLRSYQDDWDSENWGGENVYDVYSLSEIRALDGTYYLDW